MNIKEIQEKKNKMEQDILQILRNFEIDTPTQITDIKLANSVAGWHRISNVLYGVKVAVKAMEIQI